MSASDAGLCIFMRAPNLGQVKSRLAASIGDAAALAAHIALVDHLLNQLEVTKPSSGDPIDLQIWLADAPLTATASRHLQRWQRHTGQALCQQQGLNLGERMHHALAACAANKDYALLVGSDCPTIDRVYLDKAVAALRSGADVVLGPAEDGGYGLVGVTQAHPALFEGISWGSNQVLTETLAKAQQMSLEVQLLDSLWDVDYLVDWERFCRTYSRQR